MAAIGEPLIQLGESQGPCRTNRVGKVAAILSLVLGLGCVTLWALTQGEQQVDPATDMAAMATQPMRMPMAPMQPARARNFMQPVKALKSPVEALVDIAIPSKNGEIDIVMPLSRRAMMTGIGAAAAASLPLAAQANSVGKFMTPFPKSAAITAPPRECAGNPKYPKLCDFR